MTPRTSYTHPLRIDSLEWNGSGRIGMTFCPGKCDPHAMTGAWARDLSADLQTIRDWGAVTLVTLMEAHELESLAVNDLGEAARAAGLDWIHLPIRDVSIPDHRFEQHWPAISRRLAVRLESGESLVIHCRGGLGRTGLVAGLLLVQAGLMPEQALDAVRAARPRAVETREQENYLLSIADFS